MQVMSKKQEQYLKRLVALAYGNVQLVERALINGGRSATCAQVIRYVINHRQYND